MRIIPALVAFVIMMSGCDRTPSSSSAVPTQGTSSAGPSPAGGSTSAVVPILAPFKGKWNYNDTKTMAYWKATNIPANEIAQVQKMKQLAPAHPNMTLGGDLAILHGPGPMEGQYQFYALHPHVQLVCGKAWHHEDRFDPGDMDKYLIRLELRDNDLYLSIRGHEDAADPNDPEVVTMPILSGSSSTCTADAGKDPPWSPWRTYIFDRARD
jgi:hypothetical protein